MVFENIEKLKRQFTDKYVVVDERRPYTYVIPALRRASGL